MNEEKKEPKDIFSSIEDAMEDVRQGKMIVIVDDEDREKDRKSVV